MYTSTHAVGKNCQQYFLSKCSVDESFEKNQQIKKDERTIQD